jgi:hypothetical protein
MQKLSYLMVTENCLQNRDTIKENLKKEKPMGLVAILVNLFRLSIREFGVKATY